METIGREKEINQIKSALKRKANVLLVGPRGVGKSHLLKHIAYEMGEKCYYIPVLQPAKGALTQAIVDIMGLQEDAIKEMSLSRMTVSQLGHLLIDTLKAASDFVDNRLFR